MDSTRKQRKLEPSEERAERLRQESQMKKDAAKANDAAIDRMIRRNIEQYGP